MSSTVKFLSVALLLQIGVAALLILKPTSGEVESSQINKLTPFTMGSLSSVTLQEGTGEKESLTLEQKDGSWTIASLNGFPADESKVQALDKELFQATRGFAVGNTLLAAKQFKLADDNFDRKVTFVDGSGAESSILLGSSPGARKVYARLSSEEQSFSIDFESYKASTQSSNWIDKKFLRIPRVDIQNVKLKDASLSFTDGNFELKDYSFAEGEELDTDAANDVFKTVSGMTMSKVLDAGDYQEPGESLLNLAVTLAGQEKPLEIEFFKHSSDENAVAVRRSDSPFFVQMTKTAFEAIEKFEMASLIKQKESTEEVTESQEEASQEAVVEDAESSAVAE